MTLVEQGYIVIFLLLVAVVLLYVIAANSIKDERQTMFHVHGRLVFLIFQLAIQILFWIAVIAGVYLLYVWITA